MSHAHVGDHCNVGARNFAKRRKLAGMVHAHFEYARFVRAARSKNGQRQPYMVVVVPHCFGDRKSFSQVPR